MTNRLLVLLGISLALPSCSLIYPFDRQAPDADADTDADTDTDTDTDADADSDADSDTDADADADAENDADPEADGDGEIDADSCEVRCDDRLDCTEPICPSASCEYVVLSGFCHIGNSCVTEGSPNPVNAQCEVCRHDDDPIGWTSLTGEPCDDLMACNTGDTCREDGSCIGEFPCDDGLECSLAHCNAGAPASCEPGIREHYCKIPDQYGDPICYFTGDVNPDDQCQICSPELNDDESWAIAVGHECTPDMGTRGRCSEEGLCESY
jgi:hypothetical protein